MSLTERYARTLDEIRDAGLFKSERIIASPQSAEITLEGGRTIEIAIATGAFNLDIQHGAVGVNADDQHRRSLNLLP